MSDNIASEGKYLPDSNESNQLAKPVVKQPKWKTAALIAILLTSAGLIIFSSILFNASNKYSPLIEWPAPPAHTAESPVHVATIQEAWNSYNNLVIVITPCGDSSLDDSITAVTVQAANNIRSKDKIYVGVYILPQDNTLSYPIVILRLYTEAAQDYRKTMYEDVTERKIHSAYLDYKFLRT